MALAALLAAGAIASACSSAPTSSNRSASTSTTQASRPHASASTTGPTTATTAPVAPTTTSPPVQASTVQVQIAGATATIQFTSSDVSGSLFPQKGTFGAGGTLYIFTVSGVAYSGSPSTTVSTSGLIGSVAVSAGHNGAQVTIKLSSPATHASYGLGHNEVGVSFS
ncbi:MAG: hypothetical protein ACRDVP_10765 [Acidimicrobiales bacterium]